MGAERAQECVAITSHDFASMIYQTQFDVSTYDRWVLGHDMRSALRWHRRFLQVLQWKAPGEALGAEVAPAPLAHPARPPRVPRCALRADPSRPRARAGFDQQPGGRAARALE